MFKQLYAYYKDTFTDYFNLNFTLLIVFFFTTIIQAINVFNSLYIWISIENVLLQLTNDILVLACVYVVFFVPFLFLYKTNKKCYYLFMLVFAGIAILNYALTHYYINNQLPLGSNYKDYFWNQTLTKSRYTLGTLLVYLIVFIVLSKVLRTNIETLKKGKILFLFFLTGCITSIFLSFYTPIHCKNKIGYLITSLISSKIDRIKISYSSKNIKGFPFFKVHHSEDVLGVFFDSINVKKPDIVLIVVDGFAGKYLENNSEYRSFMPFLDSLISRSLYWSNFLSVTEEPYQSLPSILGSLPFGDHGFTFLDPYPKYLSLPGVLKENGYKTTFYAGFDSSKNRVDNFLLNSGITYIKDSHTFNKETLTNTTNMYQDSLLFVHGLRNYKTDMLPKLDVYMTLSLKKPGYHTTSKWYQNKIQKLISENQFSGELLKEIQGNPSLFGNLVYLDNSIRYFFNELEKKPNYANTIFLITGSTGSLILEEQNSLSRYEVPFIIFSEFLKTSKEIQSISSHLNITPTILGCLHKNYSIAVPESVSWLGYELDTLRNFRNVQEVPFFRSQSEHLDYLSGDYFYTENKTYKAKTNLTVEKFKNDKIHKELISKINTYRAKDYYSITNNKIIPDSLVTYSYNYEKLSPTEKNWVKNVIKGKSLEESYLMANTYVRNQELKKTQLICKYLLNTSPEYYDVRILLGRTYAWNNQFAKAIEHFNRVLSSNPENLEAYRALLDTYWWSNQNEKVIHLKKELENLKINDVLMQLKIARSYKALDSIVIARSICNTILKNNPNQKEALKFKNELEK